MVRQLGGPGLWWFGGPVSWRLGGLAARWFGGPVGRWSCGLVVRRLRGLVVRRAGGPVLRGGVWIEQQWDLGRLRAREAGEALLVLDEVQKLPDWATAVKRLWDEDTVRAVPLKVVLLRSSPLLVQQGSSESLAGRFEVIRVPHWSFGEMREAFDWGLDQFVFFGGYPGSAPLIGDEARWRRYITDALVADRQ